MITNKDPAVGLALDLAQGTVLACNAKLIDRRVGLFEGTRLLPMKRRVPGVLQQLLIGQAGEPPDRFWQCPVLAPECGRSHRAERHLQLLRRHLDYTTCVNVVERLLQHRLEGL
jgi:hypothetical protein